jgi:hypothetical protein
MKRFFTDTNFLIGILVQHLRGNRRLVGGIRGATSWAGMELVARCALAPRNRTTGTPMHRSRRKEWSRDHTRDLYEVATRLCCEMHPPTHPVEPARCGNELFRPKLRQTGYIISPPNMINAIFLQFMADLEYFFNLFLRYVCGKMKRAIKRMTGGVV